MKKLNRQGAKTPRFRGIFMADADHGKMPRK
jgi:hypothetical protein